MKRPKTSTSSRLYGQPGSPDNGWSDLSAEENAECADCVRGEHADDGEGHGELPVQGVSQNWPAEAGGGRRGRGGGGKALDGPEMQLAGRKKPEARRTRCTCVVPEAVLPDHWVPVGQREEGEKEEESSVFISRRREATLTKQAEY